MRLYEIISAAKAASGSKSKVAVLEAHKDNELLKAYLKAVFDPSINYYQTKLPKVAPTNMATLDGEYIQWMTKYLAGRVYTGKKAVEMFSATLSCLDKEGQELAGYIIKRKIGDGIAESSVLKVFPGLFFVPSYMRCSGMDDKVLAYYKTLNGFVVQLKADGQFAYLQRKQGKASLITRNGSYYPDWIADKIAQGVPDGKVVMGELLVYELHGSKESGAFSYALDKPLSRKEGNGVLNSILQGGGDENVVVRLSAWDMVTVEEFEAGISNRPYFDRLSALDDIIECLTDYVDMVEHHIVSSVDDAFKINTEIVARGFEGSVWKDFNGIWRDTSSGTKDAVKVKVKFQAEYVIKGYFEGEGKYVRMLGGFIMGTPCGKIEFNVGTGFDDKQRKDFWEMREELVDKIITVEANDIISREGRESLSLFLPVFIEIRNDRTEADSYERVLEQFEAAKRGGK